MASNFSFVIPGLLAGMAAPSPDDMPAVVAELKQKGVKTLICLQEQINPVVAQKLAAAGVRYLHFPVEDTHPPSQQTLEQIAQVLLEAKETKNGAVSVHCMAGKGRTGTVLASGLALVSDPPLSARDAIKEVRRLRPGSVEAKQQELAVVKFVEVWQAKKKEAAAESDATAAEPSQPLDD
eukprot:g56941.t1